MTSLKQYGSTSGSSTNLSSKTYIRSTRSGKVQKVVKEIYLREDIPCSSKLCTICPQSLPRDSHNNSMQFVLSDKPSRSSAYPNGHYLIPDTNAVLSGIDLLEDSQHFFDVIILQTVLEEVKNRSLPLYHRLTTLTHNDDKRFHVFFNEFRKETYILRKSGETINDRNDRSVRKAVQWYGDHLKKNLDRKQANMPAIVLISNDKENLKTALNEGLTALSLESYVAGLDESRRLLEMINEDGDYRTARAGQTNSVYPDHYSKSRMLTGIKDGTLYQGNFNVSPYNYLEASVHVKGLERPLLVLGRENSNRAIHGDVVTVEILPQEHWKTSSTEMLDEETVNKDVNAESEEEEAVVTAKERRVLLEEVKKSHKKGTKSHAQPTARVVGVLKRNWRQYVGHIDQDSMKSSSQYTRTQQTVFLAPMDKRIPRIRVRTRIAADLVGKRVLVAMDSWDQDSRYPTGHFVRNLGDIEAKGAETEALLLEFDVQYRPFPKAVLNCLPGEGREWKVPKNLDDPGWIGRKDFRDLLVCSIDPPGCVDIDDALHAKLLGNGNYEVGVHIADVSNFVRPDNAMDFEASIRGTTVYLVDKRIDMLPMLLGTDLCSLKPRVERFAFSVIWEITPEARILSSSYSKSVIRSREAFSYEQAQLRLDNPAQQDDLTNGMRILMNLSKKLRQKRMDAGALNLASPEVRVEIESETSDPIDVQTKKMLDTNSLVEEFMLLANISVAKKIHDAFPQTALLRRHAAPPRSNFDELQNQLKIKKGKELRTESSKALADSLDECIDPKHPFFNTLLRVMATRCMMSAEYFCSGTQAEPDYRHYGLATPIYTHFTSPIRRYADLIVHRQLAAAIEYEQADSSAHSRGKLESVCKNINFRHRNAQLAGRASVEYYVGQALKGRVVEEEGYIMKIFSNGFVVFVPRFGIESVVRLRDLAIPEPEASFDSDNYVLRILGSRDIELELFQKVNVRVSDEQEKSTGKRKVKLELID